MKRWLRGGDPSAFLIPHNFLAAGTSFLHTLPPNRLAVRRQCPAPVDNQIKLDYTTRRRKTPKPCSCVLPQCEIPLRILPATENRNIWVNRCENYTVRDKFVNLCVLTPVFEKGEYLFAITLEVGIYCILRVIGHKSNYTAAAKHKKVPSDVTLQADYVTNQTAVCFISEFRVSEMRCAKTS
jgi:hypothetical protein